MILELGQEICKMSLGHLVVCEKKVLKKKKEQYFQGYDKGMYEGS